MGGSQARWLVVFAFVAMLAAGCASSTEPHSGADTWRDHERERTIESDGMTRGGGGY